MSLPGEPDPTSPGHALGMGVGLLLHSQRRVDLASNTPSGQCGQPGLGSAGLDAVVEFIPPLPDVGFGGCNDRILNTPVNHQQALPRRNQGASACSINPGNYGSESTRRESRKGLCGAAQKQRVSLRSGHSFSALEKENNNR